VESHIGVLGEPAFVLLVGVEVIEDDVKPAVGIGGNHTIYEIQKLGTATALRMACHDLPGGHLARSKQRRRAMPSVVVALAGQGAPVGQLQITLRQWLTICGSTPTVGNRPGAAASRRQQNNPYAL
jgi:hypothetical protein